MASSAKAGGMEQTRFLTAASLDEVPPGRTKAVELGGRSILLCNSDGRVFAIENRCSHAEQPLDCGRMRLGWISCPMHGARFDLESGEALKGPAVEPIDTFAVRVIGGMIEVAV
jgi:3-phenylpropionate/trans-cinnamate dioxygenase ferredoxin subunit